jgi:hypothetical protein
MANLFLLIPLFIFCNCSTISHKNRKIDSSLRKIHNIELTEHQYFPINYLMKHPEQKGLLLAHYLGTGKTYTALAYAEKNPDQQIIVLAPSFLESNWLIHLEKMGVPNPERYKFIAYEDGKRILDRDLKNTIVIIDEAHRLVDNLRSPDAARRKFYSDIYTHLNGAKHLLLLSGTPIFTQLNDLAFLINLASGKELLPYNNRVFDDVYTRVSRGRSFWRGQMTESNILIFTMPFVLAGLPVAFATATIPVLSGIFGAGLVAGFSILPIINASVPLTDYPLREFAADKLKDVATKYISFYDFRIQENTNYPKVSLHEKSLSYNEEQIKFFIDYADMALHGPRLSMLMRESRLVQASDINLESSAVQRVIRSLPDNGREIGNFDFTVDKKLIEAPKFEKVLEVMGKNPNRVMVYSSYNENGTMLFAQFLTRKGFGNKFKILHPKLSVAEQVDIIQSYNHGRLPIILLHPDITEGLSLEGTSQVHILEPVSSQALFEQVIGRTVRLGSHSKLPPNMRKVDVYAWASNFDGFAAFAARNQDWGKRFSELSSAASFGIGLSQIDENFERKRLSPDQFANLKRSNLKNAMTSLQSLLREYSIEREQ